MPLPELEEDPHPAISTVSARSAASSVRTRIERRGLVGEAAFIADTVVPETDGTRGPRG
jgi:hypothetical protein